MDLSLFGLGEVGTVWARAIVASHPAVTRNLYDPATRPRGAARAKDNGLHRYDVPAGASIVDLTTASPDDKRHAAPDAAAAGIGYVDVTIIGLVANGGIASPLLVAGGPDPRVTELLEEAATQLAATGVDPVLTKAVAARFRTTTSKTAPEAPESAAP